MSKFKTSYRFLYQGYTLDSKYCHYRLVQYYCDLLEEEHNLEKGSVSYQKILS